MAPDPLEDALAELERGRRERFVLIGIVVVALVATVVVIVLGIEAAPTASLVAAGALVVVIAAQVVSLVVRERRSVRAIRALLAARAAHAADEARERSLGALHAATRSIASSLELSDVVDRAVVAAAGLVDAAEAVLWLRIGDGLAVAAAYGPDAPPRGTRRDMDEADRVVMEHGVPLSSGRARRASGGEQPGELGGGRPASITAPLALPDRVIGLLVVRRGTSSRPFGEDDRLTLALLAEHVALGLRNATTLDRERQRVEAFRGLVGVPPDETDASIRATRGD